METQVRRKICPALVAAALALLLAASAAPAASPAPLAGRLDPSFGHGGRVFFDRGPSIADSSFESVLRQPGGDLLLAGQTESAQGREIRGAGIVQRRLPDGAPDPSFHAVVDPGGTRGLAQQADGDILYAETRELEGTSTIRRLGPNGEPDTSYGKRGGTALPLGAQAIAVDAAGRAVVTGAAAIPCPGHECLPAPQLSLARLLPDGKLDRGFGKSGTVLVEGPGTYGSSVGVAIEPDGSIVVASAAALFGFTAAGAPNPAFGNGGVVAVEGGIAALAMTPAGDLRVATTTAKGCCKNRGAFLVLGFHADGTPDASWGSGGAVTLAVSDVDVPSALTVAPDGDVILAGDTAAADEADGCRSCDFSPYLARFDPAGAVDPSFAPQLPKPAGRPMALKPILEHTTQIRAVTVAPEGAVFLAGSAAGEGEQAMVAALAVSGAPQPGFGSGGVVAEPESLPGRTALSGLAAGPDGDLVASYWTDAGRHYEHGAVAAWGADGSPVGGYGGDADFTYASPADALQADAGGRLYRAEEGSEAVVRFGSDGKPDPGYGVDGAAALPKGLDPEVLLARPDGTVLAIGQIGERPAMTLFELTPAGLPNPSFGHRGVVRMEGAEVSEFPVVTACFDRRGRIVLLGSFASGGYSFPTMLRLLPNGRVDRSFGKGGRQRNLPIKYFRRVALAPVPGGGIYLASSPEHGGGTLVTRLRPNGTVDHGFGHRGHIVVEPHRPLLTLFASRKRLVVVSGLRLGGRPGVALTALRANGRPDRAFGHRGSIVADAGERADFQPLAAIRQADGRIVVGGTRGAPFPGEELELLRFR